EEKLIWLMRKPKIGQSNAAKQLFEAGIIANRLEGTVQMNSNQRRITLFKRTVQPVEGLIGISEHSVVGRDLIRRDNTGSSRKSLQFPTPDRLQGRPGIGLIRSRDLFKVRTIPR